MKKVLLIENFGSDFYNARLTYAKYLIDAGFEVYALVPDDNFADLIEKSGIEVFKYDFNRNDKGLFQILRLSRLYRKIIVNNNIDIIHSYRFQPNLLNVLANFFSGRKTILHVTGLGVTFSNNSLKYLILRIISQFVFLLKFIFCDIIIFQNYDDSKDLWFSFLGAKKIKVIEGSGVDISKFTKNIDERKIVRDLMRIKTSELLFICTTRLIWEKGIEELVKAFDILKLEGYPVKLWIVGDPDYANPRHVPDGFINKFSSDDINFLGRRNDITSLLNASDVFIYPSYYREGIPRSILEALSMSLPIITTKMPGCNLTVREQYNGFFINIKSVDEVIRAVKQILKLKDTSSLGKNSRILAETKFAKEIIYKKIINNY